MRLWKRRSATEQNDNVVELFPTPTETGPTKMMSKESGLIGAILSAAEGIEEPDDQPEADVIHLPGT